MQGAEYRAIRFTSTRCRISLALMVLWDLMYFVHIPLFMRKVGFSRC